MKLVHCLTRKTLKYKNLVQKVCMFLQKEASRHHIAKIAQRSVPRDPSSIFLASTFTRNMLESSYSMYFFLFILKKHMTTSFYLKCTKFTRNYASHLTCKVAHKCLNVREWVEVVEQNRKRSSPFPCCPVSCPCP